MRKQPDNLDAFASQLSSLAPAKPDRDLSLRLEMALHQANEELAASRPNNILYHPFVQWTSAAAALFMAMAFALESTQPDDVASPVASSPAAMDTSQATAQPVYQVINGQLVPTTNGKVLGRASYKGIRVLDGKVTGTTNVETPPIGNPPSDLNPTIDRPPFPFLK